LLDCWIVFDGQQLDKILEKKREEVAERRTSPLRVAIRARPVVRGFRAALEAKRAAGSYGLIAEIKKASLPRG
jgi:indole-3-glycerol phosphate synthase